MSYYDEQAAFELKHEGEIVLVEDNTEFFPGYEGNPGPGLRSTSCSLALVMHLHLFGRRHRVQ